MANRKQQNLEIERKLKKNKLFYRGIAIVIAALILAGIGLGVWIAQDSRWVLRYDGGRVAAADFRAILDIEFEGLWQHPSPMARAAAMDALQARVALIDRANALGLGFTAEERADAEATMQEWRERDFTHPDFGDIIRYISTSRMADLFHTEPLVDRLMDHYVPAAGIAIDQEEFDEIFASHVEDNYYDHMDVRMQLVVFDSLEEAEEAYEAVGTMDFEALVRQFNPWIEDDVEIEISPLMGAEGLMHVLHDMGMSEEDYEHLMGLGLGETSHIVELFDFNFGMPMYVLFYVVSIDEFDLDEVAAGLRADMVEERRNEVFRDYVMQWVEEANFRINRRGYEAT